jgi:SMP-30/Gluconolactonase/LRE-like region
MYFVDSLDHQVDVFDYDPATSVIDRRRRFAEVGKADVLPDGLTVDAEGRVWVCCPVTRSAADDASGAAAASCARNGAASLIVIPRVRPVFWRSSPAPLSLARYITCSMRVLCTALIGSDLVRQPAVAAGTRHIGNTGVSCALRHLRRSPRA